MKVARPPAPFGVAQIFNLPYRRITSCRVSWRLEALDHAGALPMTNRRYGRVQLCAAACAVSARVARILALALVLIGGSLPVRGAERAAPVHTADGTFVKDWLVLGPFPAKDLQRDFLADAGGEATVRPEEGSSVTADDGTRLTWRRFQSEDDFVKLQRVFGPSDQVVAYAYCELRSDRVGEVEIHLAADHAAAVWINGEEMVRTQTQVDRRDTSSYAWVPVKLKEGNNACLLKVQQVHNDWQFALQAFSGNRNIRKTGSCDFLFQLEPHAELASLLASNNIREAIVAGLASRSLRKGGFHFGV